MAQHLLISGNPVDGFTFVGPFDDPQEAIDHASDCNYEGDWWVGDMTPAVEDGLACRGVRCFCGNLATVLVDSDSIQYRDGQPVCDEHDSGDRPEKPVSLSVVRGS